MGESGKVEGGERSEIFQICPGLCLFGQKQGQGIPSLLLVSSFLLLAISGAVPGLVGVLKAYGCTDLAGSENSVCKNTLKQEVLYVVRMKFILMETTIFRQNLSCV